MSKKTLLSGYGFQAATRTLDLSGVPSFDIRRLAGVFDISRSVEIYAPGEPGLGFDTVTGGVIRLQADTTQLADSDVLAVIYDDDSQPLPAGAATAARQDTANGRLLEIRDAIRAQRVETIWTDDTGARFIRVDIGGAIVWTDVAGNASSPPGAGARPDSDSSTVVSRSAYRATANGTGFASGDYLDRIVVVDGDAGDVVSAYWLNATAGTRIAAPSAASISPLSPLPDGASTAARQDTGNTSLAAVVAGIGDPADTIYGGSGAASIIAALKGLYARLGAVVLAAGTAVIGKVGLQIGGSDVAASNPVPVQLGAAVLYGQDASGQIGANTPFFGPLKPSPPQYSKFNATYQASAAGTAAIYGSVDGGLTAGVLVWSKTMAAGEAVTASVPVLFSHMQARFTSGPAPTVIEMSSSFSVT